jgi:predicted alpha/beta hydrolase family esterase
MCAPGGFDARKNIDGLIAAFSMLPAATCAAHQLLIASKINDPSASAARALARRTAWPRKTWS